MKPNHRSILSRLDDAVRWTGFPARVAAEMSDTPSVDRKHRPLRWSPILPIVFSCALFIFSLIWPPVLHRFSLGDTIALMVVAFSCSSVGMMPLIYTSGPLGKPSRKDDEREATLRKDSFLFCLWPLAVLNCLGQPILMILSHLQNWQTAHSTSVAISALILNGSLFASLPTLYASWNLRQLPKE
jgi:hypothetical protein